MTGSYTCRKKILYRKNDYVLPGLIKKSIYIAHEPSVSKKCSWKKEYIFTKYSRNLNISQISWMCLLMCLLEVNLN